MTQRLPTCVSRLGKSSAENDRFRQKPVSRYAVPENLSLNASKTIQAAKTWIVSCSIMPLTVSAIRIALIKERFYFFLRPSNLLAVLFRNGGCAGAGGLVNFLRAGIEHVMQQSVVGNGGLLAGRGGSAVRLQIALTRSKVFLQRKDATIYATAQMTLARGSMR